MNFNIFSAKRTNIFQEEQLKKIEAAASNILAKIGIKVLNEEMMSHLKNTGFKIKDGRVLIEQNQVSSFIEGERKKNNYSFSEEPLSISPQSSELKLYVSQYPTNIHDIESDQIIALNTEKLIEATKLLDVLSLPGVPGITTDEPPAFRPVLQYWISANYSRYGKKPVDHKNARTLPYVMEMAEILERPIKSLPVYIASPLTVGSESLKSVLLYEDKIDSVRVGSMPSLGATAPIEVGNGFALAAAEVIGAAILLQEVLKIPIDWYIALYPVDMQGVDMVFGSPENLLLQFATSEVNAFFHGTTWDQSAGNIHTNAGFPGPQACSEKSSIMTAGAMLGARRFGAVGALSLDEIFSPEQLLYDLEIKNHVQRIIKGFDGDCDPEQIVKDVEQGIDFTFLGLESTVKKFRDQYWQPILFTHKLFSGWEAKKDSIRNRVRARVNKLLSKHEYELDAVLRKELKKVVDKAKIDLQ